MSKESYAIISDTETVGRRLGHPHVAEVARNALRLLEGIAVK